MKNVLVKVLRVRKHLLKTGKSFKNAMKCYSLIEQFENHLKCFPNISETAIEKYIAKHQDDILFLIPANPTGDSLKKQLIKL
jgi:hypothetical protein